MISSTLFIDLTTLSTSNYPATTHVKYLIELIGAHVCAFRRNTQSAYRFVERARDLCDKINSLIADVETNAGLDNYLKYTEAIDPLEEGSTRRTLLDFAPIADLEQGEFIFDPASIDACIAFIQRWENNRSHIRKGLQALWETVEFDAISPKSQDDSDDILAAHQHDDHNFMRDLTSEIIGFISKKAKLEPFKEVHTLVSEVANAIERLKNQVLLASQLRPPSDDLHTLSIKCAIISYGAVKLASQSQPDSAERFHFCSERVWSATMKLLNDMIAHLQSGKSLSDAQNAYNTFLDLLFDHTTMVLPKSYCILMKQIGKIGRPYYAQSLFLVSLCRAAGRHFDSPMCRNTKNLLALERAFDQALKTLQHAIDTTSAVTQGGLSNPQIYELEHYEDHDCTRLFRASTNALTQCFKDIGLGDRAVEHEAMLRLAMSQDMTRMTQIHEKIDQVRLSVSPIVGFEVVNVDRSKLIKLTLKILKGSHDRVLLGDFTTIGWTVTRHSRMKGELFGMNLIFQSGVSSSPDSTMPLAIDSEVDELP
ncbi:hypothetical protein BDV93DRAFT_512003 [Ceratobasidium sp. AG-I]|nr:hypothetical protein BDV93DRAFT_512003 [Ceratobasidium sp. AG-I]